MSEKSCAIGGTFNGKDFDDSFTELLRPLLRYSPLTSFLVNHIWFVFLFQTMNLVRASLNKVVNTLPVLNDEHIALAKVGTMPAYQWLLTGMPDRFHLVR